MGLGEVGLETAPEEETKKGNQTRIFSGSVSMAPAANLIKREESVSEYVDNMLPFEPAAHGERGRANPVPYAGRQPGSRSAARYFRSRSYGDPGSLNPERIADAGI